MPHPSPIEEVIKKVRKEWAHEQNVGKASFSWQDFADWWIPKLKKVYQAGKEEGRNELKEIHSDIWKGEWNSALKAVEEKMPPEKGANGFLLTRKPEHGDMEKGFNAYRSQLLEILIKLKK